jgi:RsiW-degrading membrane proteinase PrsW (M82 family)
MLNLLLISIAPVLIILIYIYYRDKYEHEPLKLLAKSVIAGAIIAIPIISFELEIESWVESINLSNIQSAMWEAFAVAALVEESLKFLILYILIWKNINFNEKFDGVVYAVFVSLGYALVENIGYVFGDVSNGMDTGIIRAFTSVPAHAMFGIMMGYWFGLARFSTKNRKLFLIKSFAYPFIFHGIYDFLLMSKNESLLLLFIPLMLYMVFKTRKQMKNSVESSFFKPRNNSE